MYNLGMIVSYSHRSYDLEGRWDSDSSDISIEFAHKSPMESQWQQRKQDLAEALGEEILGPNVELIRLEESEGGYDLVAVYGLFVTLTGNNLLNQFMRTANLSAMAALRMPPPTPDELLNHAVKKALTDSGKRIENVCRSDLISRQRT